MEDENSDKLSEVSKHSDQNKNESNKPKKKKKPQQEIPESKINFEDLISRIDNISAKGKGVKMKNKEKFLETLTSTKNTISQNKELFNSLRREPNMIELFAELEQTVYDVESKLDKLALVNFCRDKAEKYLSRKTEQLNNMNMILLSYLAGTKTKKIEVPIHDNGNEEEINNLIKQIDSMNQEILLLKNRKPEVIREPVIENKVKESLENNDVKLYKGIKYLYGINNRVNYKLAYDNFKEVIDDDKNNTEAIILLALMYEKGYYVERSYAKAFELLNEAHEKGNIQATYKLGQYAENNFYDINIRDIREKYKEEKEYNKLALKFYKDAAEKGYSDGFSRLGFIFENGLLGIKKDENVALDYFDKSVKIDDNPVGLNGIGNYLYDQKDYSKAFDYYKRAEKGGNPNAMNNLGMCLEYGRGVGQNLIKALELYKKASDYYLPDAFANQAILKIKMSIEQYADIDYKECFKLLEFSTRLKDNNKDAYYYMGLLHEIGFDIFTNGNKMKNPLMAFLYYKKAAELGHTKAKLKVGVAMFNGIENVFSSDEERGRQLIIEAANEGDEEAMMYLPNITTVKDAYM